MHRGLSVSSPLYCFCVTVRITAGLRALPFPSEQGCSVCPSPWASVPFMSPSLCSLQSDREKSEGLPVAPFMDRDKVTKATAQIGFIKFVLIPMFETVTKVSSPTGGTPAVDTRGHTCVRVCTFWEYALCMQERTHEPSTASSSAVTVTVAWQPLLLLCPVPPPPVLFKEELHV